MTLLDLQVSSDSLLLDLTQTVHLLELIEDLANQQVFIPESDFMDDLSLLERSCYLLLECYKARVELVDVAELASEGEISPLPLFMS